MLILSILRGQEKADGDEVLKLHRRNWERLSLTGKDCRSSDKLNRGETRSALG
jgi:hypothetical protein